ncbi:MAG TPA: S8 family serine peptidase [Kribbella sp.]
MLTPMGGASVSAAQPEPHRPAFSAPGRSSDSGKPTYAPNSVLVKFRKSASAAARQKALSKHQARSAAATMGDYATVTGTAAAPELLKQLKAEPSVELASLDYIRKAVATPNDTFYKSYQSSYLSTIRVPQAWDISRSAGSQTVAVLDTGVDAGHPDLKGRTYSGYNFIHPGWSTNDDNAHGTMVSGIIAANTNNSTGVAGVAWNAKILPVKVLDSSGSGLDSAITAGINWAASHGARVINMSLGGPVDDPVLHDAVKHAVAKGIVVVAAAGNDSNDVLQYPAAYPEAIAVGATDSNGALTSFSTYGSWVDIAAPGWGITSTIPRALTKAGYAPYTSGDGTSFSAPMVAGVAALMRNRFPSYTPAQIAARLKSTARDAGPRGLDPYYGAGILDAYNALGGRWAPEFWVAGPDGNDVPVRATHMAHTSITGAIGTEGDVDWYSMESAADRKVVVTVTPPAWDVNRAQNLDPVLSVYSSDLRLTGFSDQGEVTATESASVSLARGRSYIAVRNYNGSRGNRNYTVSVATKGSGGTASGEPALIQDTAPRDLASGVAQNYKPTVTFMRNVDPATVTTSTVRLLHGKTGGVVTSTVSYHAATKTVTLTPSAPLQDNTPYRISLGAVKDTGGFTFGGYSSVFRTVDIAPSAATGFDATGAYTTAALKWKLPAITDLDQIIVRRNAGTAAPAAPNTGTSVYGGTTGAATATGLANATTYTFSAWVKDRSGKYSTPVQTRLVGASATLTANTRAINYGSSVGLSGKVTRVDTKAPVAGGVVSLYGRTKNSSSWRVITRVTASATGTYSVTYKPTVSTVFAWGYNGSPELLGSRSGNVTVEVRPTITANLSPTTFKLGGRTQFYGYLRPQHVGQTVYLQRWAGSRWTTITTGKLNSTGNYGFAIKPTARGGYTYRVVWLADGDHATTVSAAKSFIVS